MSEQTDELTTERIVREVAFELQPGGDGRTIEARLLPYNIPTRVVDDPQYGGTGVPYVEQWTPNAFERQVRAPDRVKVLVNVEHEEGIRGVVGHGTALREEADGLYGTFRIHPGPDGDKALHMIGEGLLTGISVEAITMRSVKRNGFVERLKARLDKVALCRSPAYPEAQVLAVREEPEPEPEPDEPAPEPAPEPEPEPAVAIVRNAEIDEVLERVGYEPLVRRAVVQKPWSGSTARFSDDEYEASCLICRTGDAPIKERCSLPVLEPNGDVNANALGQAAGRLNQVTNVTPAQKAAAARKLMRYYRMAGMTPPPLMVAMAGRA